MLYSLICVSILALTIPELAGNVWSNCFVFSSLRIYWAVESWLFSVDSSLLFSSVGMSLRAMATYEKGLDEYMDENGNIIYG